MLIVVIVVALVFFGSPVLLVFGPWHAEEAAQHAQREASMRREDAEMWEREAAAHRAAMAALYADMES